MMTPNPGLSDLVHDLRTTLETISEGLVEAMPERLLDAEPRLAELVARLSTTPLDAASAPPRDALLAAQAALHRCQHLGSTIRSLGDVYAAVNPGYDRSGRQHGADAAGVLQARG